MALPRIVRQRKRRLLAVLITTAAVGCASSPTPVAVTNVVMPVVASAANPALTPPVAEVAGTEVAGPLQMVSFDQAPTVTVAPEVVAEDDNAGHEEERVTDLEETAEKPTGEPKTGFDADDFVSIALASHPKILAARQRVQATANVPIQVKTLPDPMFSNNFWPVADAALQTAGGRVANQMNLSQQIPWPEKLSTKANIASHEHQMAIAEVEAIEREIVEAVRLAYYELWFAERAIDITERTRSLLDDLEEVAKARLRTSGSQQDVLRAQLERDRLDEQIINLQRQKEISQADLATLLQQPLTALPPLSSELADLAAIERMETFLQTAEQCNPILRGLAAEIARDRDRERLACLQQYPDLTVGTHWGIISDHEAISPVADGNDNFSFTIGTSLPIWREKINAGVREAAHRRSSTVRRYEAERDLIYGRLRRLVAQIDAVSEQRKIYTDRIIPRTEDTLKLTVADYRGERTEFFSVIDTYRELLMLEIQLARFDANLASLLAQVDRTVGCTSYAP